MCKAATENKEHKISNPIPVDLLIEIFSRVPTKFIARFRCVSKLWGSILRRSDFTKLFLSNSSSHPRLLFTFKVDEEFFVFSSPQPRNPEANSYVVATRYNTPFPKYVPSDIIYSKSNMVYELVFRHDLIKTNVLCTTSSNIHQVLTLKNGQCLWRWIESDFLFNENYNIGGEICINGVLYFGYENHGSRIVCFDIRSEKLSIVNMDANMIGGRSLNLINCKGKLGVYVEFYGNINWNYHEFVLWILEDAQNQKWSRYTYKLPDSWYNNGLRIVGITGAGEIVWSPDELSNPFYVLYYNFERNTFTRVDVQGFEEFKHRGIEIHTFIDYVENIKLYI